MVAISGILLQEIDALYIVSSFLRHCKIFKSYSSDRLFLDVPQNSNPSLALKAKRDTVTELNRNFFLMLIIVNFCTCECSQVCAHLINSRECFSLPLFSPLPPPANKMTNFLNKKSLKKFCVYFLVFRVFRISSVELFAIHNFWSTD